MSASDEVPGEQAKQGTPTLLNVALMGLAGLLTGLAGLLMMGLVAAGMWTVWEGLMLLWKEHGKIPSQHEGLTTVPRALGSVLEGFEFLLLAPIPVIIVVTVARYLASSFRLDPENGTSREQHRQAEHQLHSVKRLVLSFMISVVATDLVRKFLENQLLDTQVNLNSTLYSIGFGAVLFMLLAAYLIVQSVWLNR